MPTQEEYDRLLEEYEYSQAANAHLHYQNNAMRCTLKDVHALAEDEDNASLVLIVNHIERISDTIWEETARKNRAVENDSSRWKIKGN